MISYNNDLKHFLEFMNYYNSDIVTMNYIKVADIRLMRSWLAKRKCDNFVTSSIARGLSAIKNFYKFLEKTSDIHNHVVFSIKSPKKGKLLLPKALSEEEVNISLDHIEEYGNSQWIEVRQDLRYE